MKSNRFSNTADLLNESGLDAILVTRFYDIKYLTGFTTLATHEREAFLLVTRKNAYVLSDGRYSPEKPPESYRFLLMTHEKGLLSHLKEICEREKVYKLGFQMEDLKWSEYEVLKDSLSVDLVAQDRVFLMMRQVKEKEETLLIGKACAAGDQVLEEVAKNMRVGMSEKEIAWNLEREIRQRGLDLAFDPIVAVDANAAIAHYNTKTGKGTVAENSIILIDFGVACGGYVSDITRMFFSGRLPDETLKAYSSLKRAQEKTVASIKGGMSCSDIDKYCRALLEKEGLPFYPHSTGHGVGLEVHEYPKISSYSDAIVQTGHVFTIEPGVYVPGRFGMRLEDSIEVGQSGKAICLTKFDRNLNKIGS